VEEPHVAYRLSATILQIRAGEIRIDGVGDGAIDDDRRGRALYIDHRQSKWDVSSGVLCEKGDRKKEGKK
jgi:hypothetical protein